MANRAHGSRRRKEWRELPAGDLSLSADTISLVSTGLPFTSAETILRIRGEFIVVPDPGATFAASDEITICSALGMVSTAATAVPATGLPGPQDVVDYPWLWWHQMKLFFQDPTPGDQAWGPHTRLVEVDTKAMRKTKPSETLALVVQNTSVLGAPPVEYLASSFRVLVALP